MEVWGNIQKTNELNLFDKDKVFMFPFFRYSNSAQIRTAQSQNKKENSRVLETINCCPHSISIFSSFLVFEVESLGFIIAFLFAVSYSLSHFLAFIFFVCCFCFLDSRPVLCQFSCASIFVESVFIYFMFAALFFWCFLFTFINRIWLLFPPLSFVFLFFCLLAVFYFDLQKLLSLVLKYYWDSSISVQDKTQSYWLISRFEHPFLALLSDFSFCFSCRFFLHLFSLFLSQPFVCFCE